MAMMQKMRLTDLALHLKEITDPVFQRWLLFSLKHRLQKPTVYNLIAAKLNLDLRSVLRYQIMVVDHHRLDRNATLPFYMFPGDYLSSATHVIQRNRIMLVCYGGIHPKHMQYTLIAYCDEKFILAPPTVGQYNKLRNHIDQFGSPATEIEPDIYTRITPDLERQLQPILDQLRTVNPVASYTDVIETLLYIYNRTNLH